MQWKVETLDAADREIESLPIGLRTRLIVMLELIETYGLPLMREPHVKHIDGKLWELRVKAAEGVARAFYIATESKRVVVLHVFEKKSQKTPVRAIAIAKRRMKSVLN